jgi:hypothetical protein
MEETKLKDEMSTSRYSQLSFLVFLISNATVFFTSGLAFYINLIQQVNLIVIFFFMPAFFYLMSVKYALAFRSSRNVKASTKYKKCAIFYVVLGCLSLGITFFSTYYVINLIVHENPDKDLTLDQITDIYQNVQTTKLGEKMNKDG